MEHCRNLSLPYSELVGTVYYTGGNGCQNCKVYDTAQPKTCARYHCAWREGHGDEGDRPDKSLMLFDQTKRIENGLEARPLAPGQESTERGRAVVERMGRSIGLPVIVIDFPQRRIQRIVGRSI